MVRLNSAQVIRQTLEQGLVTPGSSVPTLVAMSTDTLSTIRTRVETLIRDMNTKYKGLILVSPRPGPSKSESLNEEALFFRAKRWPEFAWPSSCRRKFALTPAKSSGAFAPTRTRWAAAAVVAQQPVSFGLCAGLLGVDIIICAFFRVLTAGVKCFACNISLLYIIATKLLINLIPNLYAGNYF
jgi:hypothetical protein